MGKRKRVPEDLMGTILGEDPGVPGDVDGSGRGSGSPFPGGGEPILWEDQPSRVGVTFNLSKQVGRELDGLRLDLGSDEDIRTSNSEIAEIALRIAIEEAREMGKESELVRRLGERPEAQVAEITGEDGQTIRRSVDEGGIIIETIYDEGGQVVDEDVVGSVADLPVEDEYVDEAGNLVSVAKDELGNAYEQIMDDGFNPIGTRLLPNAG